MPNWVNPCSVCPRKYRAIGGDGPRPAPVLIVLERPGRDENSNGRVACGQTGQELDELYMPLAGLARSSVRVCNTVLCWADNNKTPSDKDIRACAAHHLPEEIRLTEPEVIILAGSSACSLVPGIRLDMHHGIPQHTSKVGDLFGWTGWLIPMFHPAIGMHEPRFMTICLEDWAVVGSYIRFPESEIGEPPPLPTQYSEWTPKHSWVAGNYTIGVDTESHGGYPWSVQVSGYPGMGVLYPVANYSAMDHLRFMMRSTSEVVLHNAAYDLEVLRRLQVPVQSYRDTMQEAFHLGNLPQGLKPLVYRLFRHTMTSYQETVRPASIRALESWMTEAFCLAQLDLSYTERVQLKTKVKEVVHKGELEALLTRLMRLTDPNSEYDPWERLDDFWGDPTHEWMLPVIESRIGRYPLLGIANCDMPAAIRYAVGDADWTGQVAVELERRRGESFKVYEGDRDV